LTSGKVAVIDNERQFMFVPWRAILERHRGREVVGIAPVAIPLVPPSLAYPQPASDGVTAVPPGGS